MSNPLIGSGKAIRITESQDTTAPTVNIQDVAPDPRTAAVDHVAIVFSEPVADFSLTDLSLTRDNGANLLTSSQTLTTVDNTTWTLGNLSTLTGDSGAYALTLNGMTPRIVDRSWNLLAAGDSDDWAVQAPSVSTPTATARPTR